MTKNRRKFRIISTIMAMMLTVAMMVMGVFAATQVTIHNSGTITFTASDVFADAKVYKLTNTDDISGMTPLAEGSYNATTAPGEANMSRSVALGNFLFTKADDYFVVAITVTNTFSDANGANIGLEVSTPTVTNPAYTSYINFDVTVDGLTNGYIPVGGTATVKIKISLANSGIIVEQGAADIGFEFNVELDRQNIAA